MSQCPSDFSYSSNGICKSDPCEDGKFYDFFKKECIAKCDSLSNYKDVENNICVNSCKNINDFENFFKSLENKNRRTTENISSNINNSRSCENIFGNETDIKIVCGTFAESEACF